MSSSESMSRGNDAEALNEAVKLFEQLLIDAQQNPDRAIVRRAVFEVADAWPGSIKTQWWQWIAEAGQDLGLHCRVADCTAAELASLARDGVRWVVYCGEGQPWLAATGLQRRGILVAGSGQGETSRRISHRRLLRLVSRIEPDQPIRCVIMQRSTSYSYNQFQHGELTPFGRLRELLLRERRDLFILVVFALVAGLLTLATPVAVESLVNTVAFGRFMQPVVILAIILFAFLGFQAAILALESWVVEIIQCRLFARITADLAWRLPHVEAESTDGEYTPELMNRFFEIVTVQKVCSKLLLDGLSLVLSALVGMIVLAFYHPFLLAFDIGLIVALVFIILVMGQGAVASSIEESKCKYRTAAWLEDLARCRTIFKYDGGAEFALQRADQLTYDYLEARRNHFRILMRQIIFALATQAIASTMLLGLGGWLVISGELTLGQLVAAELIVTTIVGSFAKLGKHMESFYDVMASVDKLGHLFDLKMERQDGRLHQFGVDPAAVSISRVSYGYSGENHVLSDCSLDLESGERVAITGPSGSGKSLLLEMMFGTRRPSAGHLTIDGIDPRDLRPDVLRRRVVLVRRIEIFDGTVSENIHLNRPDLTAGNVREALSAVLLLDDVLRLPDGIDTRLNSDGEPFSATQLRQLMLARAIVTRPGLLLIDGVLDSLPDVEEQEIMSYLIRPDQPWTLLLVTGRQRLADQCNRIVKMSNSTTVPEHHYPES